MDSNFKNIHIGSLLKQKTKELEIDTSRICNFLKCTERDIEKMFLQKHLPTDILLRWSNLLECDFFRVYTQHLLLFSTVRSRSGHSRKASKLPQFRKNIYTKEAIVYILERISSGEKTKQEIITEYNIPKTTLFKWIKKNNASQ